jgi:hypothetical protein
MQYSMEIKRDTEVGKKIINTMIKDIKVIGFVKEVEDTKFLEKVTQDALLGLEVPYIQINDSYLIKLDEDTG